jgi:cytochrome c oxidase cbb3-type subunit III
MKRNNLICVKGILWYIKFTVGAATLCQAVFRLDTRTDVTWRIVPKVGLILMFFGAIGHVLCQNPNRDDSNAKPDLKGKNIFESRCAICHGLDGLGAEHAPDVVRQSRVKELSDQALLTLIHDGIPQGGMPGFTDMGKEDSVDVVAYLRFLQGKSARDFAPGNPVRGRDLFIGKAGCSACHQIRGRGEFVASDLAAYARDHSVDDIRDAILRPAGGEQQAATAVARDGRKFSGMIRNEDNASLQLQDEDGRFYLLMKSSLLSVQRKTATPMPLDYAQRLSAAELDDLIAYILRQARAPDLPLSPSGKSEEPNAQD